MDRIYLDNAATTPLDPVVLEAMMPYLTNKFGNPSSIYSYGRETRLAVENARKSVARELHASPAEIFFTSGGTESSNTAILGAVRNLHCKRIITSPIEHHATLHFVEYLQRTGLASRVFVKLRKNGDVDLEHLELLLAGSDEKTLVTLMHANNEIGNMLNLGETGKLCQRYGAIFHSDTVQTIGHYPFDLRNTPVHFISGSGHKFHGPKGTGILYVKEGFRIDPLVHGGSQERNMRAGTENLYGIVGFARALELANARLEEDARYIRGLKQYMMERLQVTIAGVGFNGDTGEGSLYTVLNASFPPTERSEMLIFNLDIHHICVSGGSACSSGASQGSHVIEALNKEPNSLAVRFSFSRHNTREEIDQVIAVLKGIV